MKEKKDEIQADFEINPLIFGEEKHRLINDVTYIDEVGNSQKINCIAICRNGIFCIETVDYEGRILGSERWNKWVQILDNGEQHLFSNPLNHTQSYLNRINYFLRGEYRIYSVIVIVQNNANKICDNVVNLDGLKEYLEDFNDETIITDKKIDEIYNTLIYICTKNSNREQVKKIEKDLKKSICPRCGGKLVLLEGKDGQFYSCSNSPKCNFTEAIK